MDFVHLHLHTQYSLLDGGIKLKTLYKKLLSENVTAVAMTDHGNMFGAIDFYSSAKEFGIKPILGCEIYIADNHLIRSGENYHLVLLCENEVGYRNLSKLSSIAYRDGFYHKPRIDFNLLREHSEGLIALSACMKGMVPFNLLKGNEDAAKKIACEYADIFKDRFYIEIQENGLDDQVIANKKLIALSKELGLPLVATNDCHYLNSDDAEAHEVLLCVQTGKTMMDANRMRYGTKELYVKSPQEMIDAFHYAPEAISNTVKIAEQCNVKFDHSAYHFPKYEPPPEMTLESLLWKNCVEGMQKRWPIILINSPYAVKKEYFERLKIEYKCICDMGFAGYFLIVADFINWAKSQKIPVGPGRGSAAGSIIAYATGITDLDPIPYTLLFERFLNPERISMPDIDVDFCQDRREEVIEYVAEKYGRDRVCQIITFGTMMARSVLRDVGRALNIPLAEVDKIAKKIPEEAEMTLEKALEIEPSLKEMCEDKNHPEYAKLLSIALKLEGLSRHASTHAAGVVIAPEAMENFLPVYKDHKSGAITTQLAMKWVEKIGLVKFDFLGLKNLTIIQNAVDLIHKNHDPDFDIATISFNDERTYKLLQQGNTTGVFQLESSGMKDLLRKMKPSCFDDIIAICALYRPGPLNSGMVDDFVECKHGRKKIEYPLPQLEPILKDTYGVIVYQEQVMKIAQVLAGYTLGSADLLRRAMGKKLPEEMAKQRSIFADGAEKNGIDAAIATSVFDLMEKFAAYGFNKSHSAAYALIAYQTAYLKEHYTIEFMTALLTSDMNNADKVLKKIMDCREMGLKVMVPDVNYSDKSATISGDSIRFGLGVVKNVGEKAVDSIVLARSEGGEYKSIADFCKRVDLGKVNKRVFESLIKCGAFDSLEKNRAALFESFEKISKWAQKSVEDVNSNQISLFAFEDCVSEPEITQREPWNERQLLTEEKDVMGFYCSGHPMSSWQKEAKEAGAKCIDDLSEARERSDGVICAMISSIKDIYTKRNEKMAVLTMEDMSGSMEVVVFPDAYKNSSKYIKKDVPLIIYGTVAIDDRSEDKKRKLTVNRIKPLVEVEEEW